MTYLKISIEKNIGDFHDQQKLIKLLSALAKVAKENDVWLFIRLDGEIKI